MRSQQQNKPPIIITPARSCHNRDASIGWEHWGGHNLRVSSVSGGQRSMIWCRVSSLYLGTDYDLYSEATACCMGVML